MSNPHAAINPRLISAITGQDPKTVKEKPTFAMLPGQYASKVISRKDKLRPVYKPNKHYLICGHCGRKGKYDLGLILFNANRWFKNGQERQKLNFMDYIQATGYFRCKHCNGAGNWESASPFLQLGIWGGLLMGTQSDAGGYSTGELRLFDGSSLRWVSDGEERFLDKLQEAGHDGYLWNRLGNLYNKGGRPELAVVAFEQSIRVDPAQIESHYSLGDILFQIGEDEKAAYHFHMMLVYARFYEKLDAIRIRDMLSAGLQNLFKIYDCSKHAIPFLPSREDFADLNGFEEMQHHASSPVALLDFNFHPDDQESFRPIAEIYMGNRRMEIPVHDRTLDKHLPNNSFSDNEVKKEHAGENRNDSILSKVGRNANFALAA